VTNDNDFFQALAGALDALEAEVPIAHGAFCEFLQGLSISISMDGNERYLQTTLRRHELTAESSAEPVLAVVASRGALLALLEDRQSLVESVRSDAISLQGGAHDLMRLEEALFVFVRGAVRSRTCRELFARFSRPASSEQGRALANTETHILGASHEHT
jgi:hypothetical protein